MSRKLTRSGLTFRLLVLVLAARSLVVPGLAPVLDGDSPLGFRIEFCDQLAAAAESRAGHHHGDEDGAAVGHVHDLSLPSHCDASFMDGMFTEPPVFDLERYLQTVSFHVKIGETVPCIGTCRYQNHLSRDPPHPVAI